MVEKTPEMPASRPEGVESPAMITGLIVFAVVFIILGIVFNTMLPAKKDLSLWTGLLGLVSTLAIFTILYKDNPVFRYFEHIFVGLAVGYGIVAGWVKLAEPKWYIPMMPKSIVPDGGGHWLLFLALPIGLLFFTVYFPKLSWMNRFALSIFMGWAAGNALQQFIGLLAPQIVAAFRAPITRYETDAIRPGLNNFYFAGVHWHLWWLISIVVLTCTMAYFFFSIDYKKANWIRIPSNYGRYFIMIALGAIFGTTVMGRFSLLIERLDNIIRTTSQWWLAIIHHFH